MQEHAILLFLLHLINVFLLPPYSLAIKLRIKCTCKSMENCCLTAPLIIHRFHFPITFLSNKSCVLQWDIPQILLAGTTSSLRLLSSLSISSLKCPYVSTEHKSILDSFYWRVLNFSYLAWKLWWSHDFINVMSGRECLIFLLFIHLKERITLHHQTSLSLFQLRTLWIISLTKEKSSVSGVTYRMYLTTAANMIPFAHKQRITILPFWVVRKKSNLTT
jgi:hypothetical protein